MAVPPRFPPAVAGSPASHRRPRLRTRPALSRSLLPPVFCLFAALAGCGAEEDGIRVYTVENVSGDAPATAAPPVAATGRAAG